MNLRTSGPWHYIDEKEYFAVQACGFTTELGSPSVPTAESMRKFIPESERWPISDTWYYHDLHFGLPEYCQAVDDLYGKAESLDDFCRKAQLINYDSHRAMLEAWNSRMWNSASGCPAVDEPSGLAEPRVADLFVGFRDPRFVLWLP